MFNLSDDIIVELFLTTNTSDYINLFRTCNRLYKLSQSPHFWTLLLKRDYQPITDHFTNPYEVYKIYYSVYKGKFYMDFSKLIDLFTKISIVNNIELFIILSKKLSGTMNKYKETFIFDALKARSYDIVNYLLDDKTLFLEAYRFVKIYYETKTEDCNFLQTMISDDRFTAFIINHAILDNDTDTF